MTEYEIIEWIKAEMKRYKISYAKMGDLVYVTEKTIAAWMNHRVVVKMEDVMKMLKVFGYELQIVRAGEGNGTGKP